MTDRFRLYARYYDLLYKDKDYKGEAEYVHELIRFYRSTAIDLLNLGSGTGKHDYMLARWGYNIAGIDISAEMIELADKNTPADIRSQLKFAKADIRSVQLEKKFDAVVSLFHVMSYQVANQDIVDVFDTAHKHLDIDGLFIFDCWYGPGVLNEAPEVRIKRMSDDAITVTRLAEPVLHPTQNIVDVNYTININQNGSDETAEIKELHKMRYFFVPEIELLIQNKFKLLSVKEWLKAFEPTINSWNAIFVLQKI